MVDKPVITFEQLPAAVTEILARIGGIEDKLREIQPAAEEDEILNIDQAAHFLKISKYTVYNLVSKAAIPYSKKGKPLYFSKRELKDWIMSGRRKTRNEIKEAL